MKKITLPGTLCRGEKVSKQERFLGYLVGPLGFGFLSLMVNSYLNVYYTDVCGLGRLWGSSFMSVYPILVKGLGVLTYLAAGWLVDRTVTTQGKARPYLLLSGALLPVSALLLFLVPQGNDFLTAAAVLCSNLFFFAVVATLYGTANTLMVPLSSTDPRERSQLAVTVNAQGLLTGTTLAVVFPAVILPVADVPARLCYRNLLYTGVTRARKLCVLTGTARTEQTMVENVRQNMRYSGLRYLLKDAATPTEEKQEQLESNTSTAEDAKKAAERAVEDAGLSADIDHTQEINAISLEQFQKQLEKLKTLKQQNGEITAPSSGIITKVCVETGQKTTDTAAVVMSDEQSGLFFTTTTDSKNREYLSVGDNATITGVGKETSDCSIVSLETSKDGSSIKVSIAMQGDDFLPGESAQMTATRKSEIYDYLVPVTAVWQENNKAYVLLLETENTVLGEQYIARKAEVQILDKNSSYAAVSGNSLSADCQIITDSDRTVGNGDVVRMTE